MEYRLVCEAEPADKCWTLVAVDVAYAAAVVVVVADVVVVTDSFGRAAGFDFGLDCDVDSESDSATSPVAVLLLEASLRRQQSLITQERFLLSSVGYVLLAHLMGWKLLALDLLPR